MMSQMSAENVASAAAAAASQDQSTKPANSAAAPAGVANGGVNRPRSKAGPKKRMAPAPPPAAKVTSFPLPHFPM